MSLPEQIPLRYSDEDPGYVSVRPIVKQTFRLHELIDMIVSVVGKDITHVQQTLRTGTVVYNGYHYSWDSLSAQEDEVTALLASFPDDDPLRPFDPAQASGVLFESGGGTQRTVTEISHQDASDKKLFGKNLPWDLLVGLAASDPPRYERYSHAHRADLFRVTLPYDRAQQLLAAILESATRTLRHRWSALRPPSAITFICPR
jgi:hypothetical protein